MNFSNEVSYQSPTHSELNSNNRDSSREEKHLHQDSLIIGNPKGLVFAIIFLLLFCFGFIFSVLTNFTFRAALLSLLVLPLFLFYRSKVYRVTIYYVILVVVVVLSGIQNKSSLLNVLLFMRVLVFSYLIYYLVKITLTPNFITKVVKVSIWIAMIQLPIMLLQWQLYDYLPLRLRGTARIVDFGSGTFTYKTDYAMVFFLTMIVIFLLFEDKRNQFVKHRFIKALWLSGTVMVANSQIMKVALLLIWFIYVIKGINAKKLIIISFGVVMVGGALFLMASKGLITEEITTFIANLRNTGSVDTYLSGGYSRTAALRYLVTDGFSWLGAGPSAFSDPLTKTLYRGNTGHSFTFFSEIGFFGWLASTLILFVIAFPVRKGKIILGWSQILIFISIFILSFTSNVMNDIGVFFMFCIMCNIVVSPITHLGSLVTSLPNKKQLMPSSNGDNVPADN